MPDQHCPTCGAARSTGCGCVPDPSLTETAVLPHLEGPPLVRPYVPRTADQVADEAHPNTPVVDPFATTVLPPVPPGQAAVPGSPAVPPLGPDADAYATTVLPPVGPVLPPVGPGQSPFGPGQAPFGQDGAYPDAHAHPGAGAQPDAYATAVLPPVPPGGPGGYPAEAAQPRTPASAPDGNEIGLFPFGQAQDFGQAPSGPGPDGGGRAARRAAEQAGRRPLARRKGLLAGVGAALVALTIGVAYAVTPSAEPPAKQAQPLPTTTLAPAPVDPPTLAAPAPSAPPPTSEAPSPTPTPTPTRRPSPTKTAAPTPVATPTVEAPAAPPVPVPTPTAPPVPTPTPVVTPTPRVLQYGMSGPDVTALQQKLAAAVSCFASIPVTGVYDDTTVNTVDYVQWKWNVKGDKRGVYGPNTSAALDKHTSC
ncbi:peptidoglycan-binding protein [Kitasatospora sp. NPDC096204]|uniref:peptidoglycan-binding domain-containing protein n=1 Tax=Kitasatospora sp. NPDC096204 TaxID=3364094 RepID=UPI0038089BBD